MYTYIIVDDEPLIRRGTIKKLENYPDVCCIGQASNGEAALTLLEEKNPDFIITDMKMPIMDGTKLLPLLSTQYPDKYIIVISGYKDFEYAQEALRANTLDYIVKPFSQDVLQSAVSRAIHLLESRHSLTEQLTLNEAEKELLKYQYDKQILKNLLFGIKKDIESFTSQKMQHIQQDSFYTLITITLKEQISQNDLQEFLNIRKKNIHTIVLTRDNTENMGFILLFYSPQEKPCITNHITDILKLLDQFFESYKAHPFYGISDIHKDMSALQAAFLETTDALNQMTLLSDNNYAFFKVEHKDTLSLNWPKLEQFLFLVESGHTDNVKFLFSELFHYFARTQHCRLKDAKEYCLEISETLKKSLPQDMQIHKSAATSLNLLNNLNYIFSFEELETYFLQFFCNMSMAFENAGFYSEKDIIENIKKYIDLHYEKTLTLEFVSSLFHLNRSYLSSAFKSYTNINFVDYINQVRVEHAKELLTNTTKKTYQVAQAVGYDNAKYFFRIFKKIEGLTPEQYRSRHNN